MLPIRELPERLSLVFEIASSLSRDDDRGYTAWPTGNARGHVLNIQRSTNPSDARVHEVSAITGTPPRGRTWTGHYVKACSPSLTELDA
jgi:hypothetical protein